MDDKLLTRPEVELHIRLRKSALYRLLRDPNSGFPAANTDRSEGCTMASART